MVLKLIYKDTVIKTLTYELWEISIETCTPVYIQKIQLLGKKFKCYLIFNAGFIGQVNLSNTVIHHKDKVISDVKTYSKL